MTLKDAMRFKTGECKPTATRSQNCTLPTLSAPSASSAFQEEATG
jgi:hypothetical protein